MIIALGSARPAPGRRDELVAACRSVAELSRQDDGCLDYGFHVGLDDSDEITSVEVWQSQEHLDAHMDHDHTQDFLNAVASLTDGDPQLRFFHTESLV